MECKKKKNAFTLVELIAVLIVLILLFLLAMTSVKKNVDKSHKKAAEAGALSTIKGAKDIVFSPDNINSKSTPMGYYTLDELFNIGLKLSGKKPTDGYLFFYNGDVKGGCLQFDDYKVNIINTKVKKASLGSCGSKDNIKKTTGSTYFSTVGSEKTYTISTSGKYLVEAWGAQGGNANSDYIGGYGGYSSTILNVPNGESVTLYINIGGEGKSGCNKSNCVGGYNGGSDSGTASNNTIYYGAGGGATSVALKTGLLSSLSSDLNKILVVAGGGGGASYINNQVGNNGGSGGGYVGGSSATNQYANLYYGTGATQSIGGSSTFTSSTGGSFGQGGTLTALISNFASSGAGGGLYGGGYAGGGGSGYVAGQVINPTTNNTLLTSNSVMYCFNCYENTNANQKTIKTDAISSEAISLTAKKGNGAVRITYLGE